MFRVVLYVSSEVDGEFNRLKGCSNFYFYFSCKNIPVISKVVLSFISSLEHGKYHFQISIVIICKCFNMKLYARYASVI